VARGKPFDLVLLDYQLPEESGIDFLRALRATPAFRALPVIVASSAPVDEWQDPAERALAGAHLRKPIRQSTLHETMLDVMGIGKPPRATAVQPHDDVGSQAAMATPVSSLRILVAEDNRVNQMVAKMLLSKLGHRVDVVANGIEAVEAVRTLPYDLVFMDMQMPEMDGLDATRAIRSLDDGKSTISIVAMTANALKSDEERCLDAGMNGFVLKPVEKDKLSAMIASMFPTSTSS
jgi:CheY-like chemotaxis protein